ncbi:MAG: hypothetical protein JXK05_04075 [Campylobacterales bacterium]|nr:hypothetical protein [Campylobacterales bacterium]
MKTTKSRYRIGATDPKLLGGDFGFDTIFGRLYAGFGNLNRRVLLDTDDTGWIAVATLENGWEQVLEGVAPAYRKDAAGVLHVTGELRYGALNYAAFRLPDGYRPTRPVRKVIPMRDGMGLVDISTDGYVTPVGTEEMEYDEITGEPTGEIIEVGYLSLEMSFVL